MKIGPKLAKEDPRITDFKRMLNDYGLSFNQHAFVNFLRACPIIEDNTPAAINDRREYYRTVYLKTDHWRHLKSRKLAIVKACEFCGSKSNLDVHHRRYRQLYDVELDDLAVLCRKCHDELHGSIDSFLRGAKKERVLDKEFIARLPINSEKRPRNPAMLVSYARLKERLDKQLSEGPQDEIRVFQLRQLWFHVLLKRMISVSSKIRSKHGVDGLSKKIRPLFRKNSFLTPIP